MNDPKDIADIRIGFGQSFVSIARLWRRAADLSLEKLGLSHATATPLRMLRRMGGEARQGAIAEASGIEGPGLVRIVDLLVAEGYVTRREDASDRRAKILVLTARGQTKADKIEKELTALRNLILADVSEEELRSTTTTIARIEKRIRTLYDL
ncbi:MarR family winged helix-turn-helix transcriptional regulator [Limoniibacter endophyticus]|uniref:Transcriptional regulator n=1 Tax=Limoniibacter endophyticus TaxID=1565040 RepID=A0A8J3DJN2_9HYPH|nr:MarR family transcriptional regulator [Limoniibacter endophyticus]GHC74915.1 transcriptional regulator [Limoniibacter endophyticus]